MIKFTVKGSFNKTYNYLERVKRVVHMSDLDKFGKAGVEALALNTPVDTGKTANSWYYTIEINKNSAVISFNNSNIQNGVPIAIILQYGHGTRHGGWVEGRDYINPAIQPIFDQIVNDAWKEVTKL